MFIQWIRSRVLPFAVTYVAVIGVATSATANDTTNMSWYANTRKTIEDGVTVTSEGTAEFATGEKAHVVLKGVADPHAAWYRGTGTIDSVYQFDDGSSFTLRYVQIWDAIRNRATGLFGEGTGRFAGIRGEATGRGEASGGPISWTGTYTLPKK